MRSFLGTFGVVHHFEFLNLPFGIVGDDKFHRIEDSRNTGGTFVEVGTHCALEQFHIVECIEGGVTDLIDELADAFRAVTATTNATNGRHTGIVPTIDYAFFRQNQEISLGHQRVVEIEFVELKLTRTIIRKILSTRFLIPVYKEVVKRAVGNKFEGADGVGYTFEIVALTVREVIHGISVPFVAGTNVRHVEHAVHNGIAEVHIVTRHINLGAQHHFAGLNASTVHFFEQAQGFFHRTVAVRAGRSGTCGRTLLRRDLLAALFVDISATLFDQGHSKLPKVLKVVGGIEDFSPMIAQPLNISLDRFHIFVVFLLRVGIVHAEVADAAELLRHSEVQGDGFGVSDVQVAVGFRRETRLKATAVLAGSEIIFHDLLDKVERFLFVLNFFGSGGHIG